jgi:hypothetical protein
MTGNFVELHHRVKQVVNFYHMFKTSHKLSEWLSWTKVSLGGLQTSNRREITLSGSGTREAKLLLGGDETAGEKKDLTHEESRTLGYILVTMLAVVLTQEIGPDEYTGYEESGKDILPGKTEKVRLGLSGPVRNRLMQRVLCMGGRPPAYLAQVDVILMRIITLMAEESKHPDDHIRGLMTTAPGLFVVGANAVQTKQGAPGTASSAKDRAEGEKPTSVSACLDWINNGKCRFKDVPGPSRCALKHPARFDGNGLNSRANSANERNDRNKKRRGDKHNDKKNDKRADKDKDK